MVWYYLMNIPYIRVWTRIFKYKERDSRLVFLVDVIIHLVLFFTILFLSAFLLSKVGVKETVAWIVLYSLSVVFLIPLVSMMGRRSYDIGESPYEWIFMMILFPLFFAFSAYLIICPSQEKKTKKNEIICDIIIFVLFLPSLLASYLLGLSIEYIFSLMFI